MEHMEQKMKKVEIIDISYSSSNRGCGQVDLDEDDLRRLNFHNKKIPWTTIGLILDKFDLEAIFEGRNVEECTYIFLEIIKTMSRKNTEKKSKITRERKTLLNKIKMLEKKKTEKT